MRPDIVVADRLMQAKVRLATRAAATDLSVLLIGEHGVGKSLFAKLVHSVSRRHANPFEVVNCATVPPNLIEGELFGYTSDGSASSDADYRPGRLELANEGTILLESVDALTSEIQGKLLAVLQQGRIYPAGGHDLRIVDTRIIATSDLDLEIEVERGAFRRDLFYRLNVLPIYLPPLRERPNDVSALAKHFLQRSCAASESELPKFSSAAVEALRAHGWPGNVRELLNIVEGARIAADSVINVGHLNLESTLHEQSAGTYDGESLKEAVRDYKRDFIRGALESHGWNQTTTARSLAIQRTYLSRLIKELEISNR